MLDKIIINLKNRIFFKTVTYLIFIVLLGSLVPIFQEELVKSSKRKRKAQDFLSQANIQLGSIQLFEEQINETNLKYKELLSNPGKKGCSDRTDLIQNLDTLSKKYNLYDPIKVEISRLFEDASIQNKNAEIKLHDYEAIISFRANTNEEVIKLSNDICTLLPHGALVISTSVKKIEALTPEIIDALSTEGFSGLINVSIKVRLREIVYEQ
mgnify:CR=1 FL=1